MIGEKDESNDEMTLTEQERARYDSLRGDGATHGEAYAVATYWRGHAHPLQQITVGAQGTKHSDRAAVILQLEIAIARLRAGETTGSEHDDDFGYSFVYVAESARQSFFDSPAGKN